MTGDSKNYEIGFSFWLQSDGGHFLGKGRVELLENIRLTGSITQGARAMKMSYRQAWQMVEDMNKQSRSPLVEKISGGAGGGGARITPAGDAAIVIYHKLHSKIDSFVKKETAKLKL